MTAGVPWAAWWAAPGPVAFLDEALDTLRQGRTVLLGMPRGAPPGLAEAVEAEVVRDCLWRWTAITPTDRESPLSTIVQALWGGAAGPDSLAGLVRAERLRNHVLWVGPLTGRTWAVWRDWLLAFARQAATLRAGDRPVISAELHGIPRGEWPRVDPTLAVLQWRGRLDALDMELWAATLLRGVELPPFAGRLRRELLAALAGADPLLAVQLRNETVPGLCRPEKLLADYAVARGWQSPPPHTWEAGVLERIAGESILHLAALTTDSAALAKAVGDRLWRAEVRVLFPLIETLRRRLIERHRDLLRVPVQVEGRPPILHVEDLELGHLHRQLQGRIGANRADLLAALHRVRNALAHLEPLPEPALLDLLRRLDATDLWQPTGRDTHH